MNRRGLSIIEALVALALISIALAALAPTFTSFSNTNRQSELRGGAIAVAQQILDTLRQQRFSEWPANGEIQTISSPLGDFEVQFSYCQAGSANCFASLNTRHIRLVIRRHERVIYEVETVYTRFD